MEFANCSNDLFKSQLFHSCWIGSAPFPYSMQIQPIYGTGLKREFALILWLSDNE